MSGLLSAQKHLVLSFATASPSAINLIEYTDNLQEIDGLKKPVQPPLVQGKRSERVELRSAFGGNK
jgi:hypothetical protein